MSLATGLVLLGLVAPAATASADVEDADDPTDVRLVVPSLTAVVGPALDEDEPREPASSLPGPDLSARVVVVNDGDQTLDDGRLVVEVQPRSTSRSALQQTIDGGAGDGSGRILLDLVVPPVAPGRTAQLEVRVPGAELDVVDPDHDVSVHPLVLAVVRGNVVLDEVRTAVVGVARDIARPLETAIVLPLDGPAPATTEQLEARAEQLRPGARLDRLVAAVEGAPAGAVTTAPAAHVIEDLSVLSAEAVPGTASLLERLQLLLANAPSGPVSSPYALADIPTLVGRDATASLAADGIELGRQRLGTLTRRAPASAHLLLEPQTAGALELAPVDVLLSRWNAGAGPDLSPDEPIDLPPALRPARAPSGRPLTVLVADPWVTEQLGAGSGEHGWPVDAQRVVAETAMLFAEEPGHAGRSLLVLPPHGWDAPGQLPAAVVGGLTAAPWLRTADPVTVVARSTEEGPGWAPVVETASPLDTVLTQLASTAVRLDGLRSAVPDLSTAPDVFRRRDDLLRATSTWPSGDRLVRARALLTELDEELDRAVGEVTVPDDTQVTLASASGAIPITVQHPSGIELDVVVEVDAQGLLNFGTETTRQVRLAAEGATTVSFEATPRGRGTFPLAVTVRTPEGDVVLDRALVSVRASAVSTPALAAIGVVVVLLVLVGRNRRRRREGETRPRLEVVR